MLEKKGCNFWRVMFKRFATPSIQFIHGCIMWDLNLIF